MSYRCKPEDRIAHTRYRPAVKRRLIDLVCSRLRLAEHAVSFEDLLGFSDAEIRAALSGRGVRHEWVDEIFFDLARARQWLLPIGTRQPMEPGWEQGLEDDAALHARQERELDEPRLAVWMAPNWLSVIERLLNESDLPEARVIAAGMQSAFELAREERATYLDLTPRDKIDWQFSEGGYELRISSDWCPMISVYRRWDAQVGPFAATILQVNRKVGVGAYYTFIDIERAGEGITHDHQTFEDAERALIEKLELRFPVRPQASPPPVEKKRLSAPVQRLDSH